MGTETKQTTPQEAIGKLPQYACSHWTGYGIDSELCQSYLHVLSALKAIKQKVGMAPAQEIYAIAEAAINRAERGEMR